jgi:predicted phage baseplate assembly protein
MASIAAEVHRRDRAVTSDDFRDLAGQVAGVGRAETLSLFHPDTPGERAAGVVSMVIFPDADLRDPGAPLPELGLLRRVARHLDARRLITTELYVIPPEYVPISLSVGVEVRDGFQVDAVRRWVELILRQYLAPLPPYGPDGSGWPLGRAVRRAELEAVAVQVEGVEYLEDLVMAPAGDPTATDDASVPLIPLERWQVPSLAQVTVVQGRPLALGAAYEPDPPVQVPVLLPPDTC